MSRAPKIGSAKWLRERDPKLADRFAALAPEMRRIALAQILGEPSALPSPELTKAISDLADLREVQP